MSWHATILTLFPGMFPGPLGASLAGRALEDGVWRLDTHDIRDHGLGRHRTVDDAPFGGGRRHGDAARCHRQRADGGTHARRFAATDIPDTTRKTTDPGGRRALGGRTRPRSALRPL